MVRPSVHVFPLIRPQLPISSLLLLPFTLSLHHPWHTLPESDCRPRHAHHPCESKIKDSHTLSGSDYNVRIAQPDQHHH